MVARWYFPTMQLPIDRAGRLVVPKALRDALGLGEGGVVDVSLYGQGLQIVPSGRTARIVQTEHGLAAESETVVTDETIFGLVDAMRR
jgi:AbrB family looped-hinge helix DNA binding protein